MVDQSDVRGYFPVSLSDALDFLVNTDAMIFAGGTDLMVKHRRWGGLTPDFNRPVLFIAQLHALKGIQLDGNRLTIRAATPISNLLASHDVPHFIKVVLGEIASVSIRNMATIGGNICNASPAGDSIPMLMALDAELEIASLMDKRLIKVEDFITGPGKTDLKRGELVTAIHVNIAPLDDDGSTFNHFLYKKIGQRKGNAISKVSFFGIGTKDATRFLDVRMAYGAAGPTVIRDRSAEALIRATDHDLMFERTDLVLETVSRALRPIDDLRSTKDYRRDVLLNLTRSFILGNH